MPPSNNMTNQAPPFGYHGMQSAYQHGPASRPDASPSHSVYSQPGYQQYSQVTEQNCCAERNFFFSNHFFFCSLSPTCPSSLQLWVGWAASQSWRWRPWGLSTCCRRGTCSLPGPWRLLSRTSAPIWRRSTAAHSKLVTRLRRATLFLLMILIFCSSALQNIQVHLDEHPSNPGATQQGPPPSGPPPSPLQRFTGSRSYSELGSN